MLPLERRTILVLALALALSWLAREVHHRRIPLAPAAGGGWITTDPDSHYHMRRVERALDEHLAIAPRDLRLNFPHGANIPWPPYYAHLASALLAPFAPEEPGRRHAWIERGVASLPIVFGVLATLVACLAGLALAGELGALAAGLLHALSMASIAYSKPGNGDHHAWVSLLAGAMLLALARALRPDALAKPRASAAWGALAGALAGLAGAVEVTGVAGAVDRSLASGVGYAAIAAALLARLAATRLPLAALLFAALAAGTTALQLQENLPGIDRFGLVLQGLVILAVLAGRRTATVDAEGGA